MPNNLIRSPLLLLPLLRWQRWLVAALVGFVTLGATANDLDTAKADLNKLSVSIQKTENVLSGLSREQSQQASELKKLLKSQKVLNQKLRASQKRQQQLKQSKQHQQQALTKVRNGIAQNQEQLGQLIRQYYRSLRQPSSATFLAGDNLQQKQRIRYYTKVLSTAQHEALAELFSAAETLETEQKKLLTIERQVSESTKKHLTQLREMNQLITDTNKALVSLKKKHTTTSKELTTLTHQKKELEALIAQLKKTASFSGNIKKHKGKLPWPMVGTPRAVAGHWIIKASTNTPVKAIHSGKVVFADWMAGFGNLVLIDHGQDVVSIYAGLSELEVQQDQTIKSQQQLGRLSASGANSKTPGLFFEIRYKGKTTSPKAWLSSKSR